MAILRVTEPGRPDATERCDARHCVQEGFTGGQITVRGAATTWTPIHAHPTVAMEATVRRAGRPPVVAIAPPLGSSVAHQLAPWASEGST
jgi:hypothetical protein